MYVCTSILFTEVSRLITRLRYQRAPLVSFSAIHYLQPFPHCKRISTRGAFVVIYANKVFAHRNLLEPVSKTAYSIGISLTQLVKCVLSYYWLLHIWMALRADVFVPCTKATNFHSDIFVPMYKSNQCPFCSIL